MVKRKIPRPHRESNPRTPTVQPSAIPAELSWLYIPGSSREKSSEMVGTSRNSGRTQVGETRKHIMGRPKEQWLQSCEEMKGRDLIGRE
jgi:hypothetical protein